MTAIAYAQNDEVTRLVAQAIDGSMDALADLFERYRTVLISLAYRSLGDIDDARDVVGDTFIRAANSIRRMPRDLRVSGWLVTIMQNLCLDFLRRRQRAFMHPWEPFKHDVLLGQGEPDPEEDVLRRERHAAVHRTMARLPEIDRVALEMLIEHGEGCEAIGRRIGLSRSATKSRLFRARIRFGLMFMRYEPDLVDDAMRRNLLLRQGNDVIGIDNAIARMEGEVVAGNRRQARYRKEA